VVQKEKPPSFCHNFFDIHCNTTLKTQHRRFFATRCCKCPTYANSTSGSWFQKNTKDTFKFQPTGRLMANWLANWLIDWLIDCKRHQTKWELCKSAFLWIWLWLLSPWQKNIFILVGRRLSFAIQVHVLPSFRLCVLFNCMCMSLICKKIK